MIKALLISDTHGNLDCINPLIKKTKADIVIHAGGFGFYDETSYRQISTRELYLQIKHSTFNNDYKDIDKQTDRDTLIKITKKHRLLGQFDDYLNNTKQFDAPVYAVYGNHEDVRVLRNLQKSKIKNLFLLDEKDIYDIKDEKNSAFKLFGLGGNFLMSNKILKTPIAGNAGKVLSTLHQFGVLYQKLINKTAPSIFVSHVSPGKEPLLTRLLIHYLPNVWISGHMGAPHTCIWNQFTIREMDESLAWFDSQLGQLNNLEQTRLTPEARIAFDLIKQDIPKKDTWFKQLWNINLPDVIDGYSMLTFANNRFYIETLHEILV